MATTTSKLLSRNEAAELLGISPNTLAVWASVNRHALPYVKLGRRALYRASDIEAFINANLVVAGGAQ